MVDATNGRSRAKYQLTPTLIALIMLTQGSPDIKAKAICELFCGQRLLKPAPLGIRASQMNKAKIASTSAGDAPRDSIDTQARSNVLTKEQLTSIVQIIVNVSLTLLPLYASDFPSEDKRSFVKTLIQWFQRKNSCVEALIKNLRIKGTGQAMTNQAMSRASNNIAS